MRKSLRKISAAIAGCALAMALTVGAVPNAANAAVKPQCTKDGEKAGKAKFNPDGTYHAYFGLQQQNTWIFRDQWFSPTLGVKGTDLAGNDYASILQSKDGKVLKKDGTVTDAEITGNGTYTIGVTGLNGCIDTDLDANPISMIYASTDIPISAIKDGTVKISDVKMSIDGREASQESLIQTRIQSLLNFTSLTAQIHTKRISLKILQSFAHLILSRLHLL